MKQDGNLMDEYDIFHPKLKRKPFMTIVVSIVGKHFEQPLKEDPSTSMIYKIDPDDPQLFESGICEKVHNLFFVLYNLN